MADLRPAAAELDLLLSERVLVTGSSPADASDLDLLARPTAAAQLQQVLPAAGFAPWRGGWMRLRGCAAEVVEVEVAADWRLPAAELQALFDLAEPVGLPEHAAEHVVEPAPHHTLLVLARRLRDNEGRMDARRLARARAALLRRPDAFVEAQRSAAAWGCSGALEILRADLEGRPLAREQRAELLAEDGLRAPSTARLAARAVRRARPRRGVVVAVSGLDGAGKSTQAEALAASLTSLGYEPVLLWQRISYSRLLVLLAAVPKAALRRLRPASPVASALPAAAAPSGAIGGGAAEGGSSSAAVRLLWSVVVTLVHVLAAGPATRRHLRQGRVVIRDRYALDAMAHVLYRYGERAPLPVHRWLLRRVLPRPAVAWFLDVPAQEAHRRKPEQFDVDALARQRAVYLRECASFGVTVVDATRPRAALCDELARVTLDCLAAR